MDLYKCRSTSSAGARWKRHTPFDHDAGVSASDLVAQILDRVPDLAAALAESLFDFACRPFGASFVFEVADFFLHASGNGRDQVARLMSRAMSRSISVVSTRHAPAA
jgi:hypothetical protein